jgi:hypothetical protein
MKCDTDRYEGDNYHSPSGLAVLVLLWILSTDAFFTLFLKSSSIDYI